jgi:hypothetical protein
VKGSLLIGFVFLSIMSYGQRKSISGYLLDKNTGFPIANATFVSDSLNLVGFTTDEGFYSFSTEKFPVWVKFSHVGYQAISHCFEAQNDSLNVLYMKQK